jgi:predicted amidohydrolase YtcJ
MQELTDMVLVNGRITTMDRACPEVQAVAIRGGRFIAVGTNEQIRPLIGRSTREVDLDGRRAVPGFVEGHGHLIQLGLALQQIDLRRTRNWASIVEAVRQIAALAKPGEWIQGDGWHQEKWNEQPDEEVEGFPTNAGLTRAAPDNPVLLIHSSHHVCVANARALELAGLAASDAEPAGGRLVRDPEGRPTGILIETAAALMMEAAERASEARTAREPQESQRRAVRLAQRECLAKGVTSFHDALEPFETIDLLKTMANGGELELRLWVMVNESNARLRAGIADYRLNGFAAERLTVRAIKRLMDGALGPSSAWMLEPYADQPATSGFSTLVFPYEDFKHGQTPRDYIRETAAIAAEHGFQLCTHAIGDRAVRETLDVYEEALRSLPGGREARWRIEHACMVAPEDVGRFGKLGVIASMQSVACLSDGRWMISRMGEARAKERAFIYRQLRDTGALIMNGSDAPVDDVDPIRGFYAVVTGETDDGSVFWGDQRMTREEALCSYTLDGARGAFQEQTVGSIQVGKLADVVVLSEDIMAGSEEAIRRAKVAMTVVGGKIAYENWGLAAPTLAV